MLIRRNYSNIKIPLSMGKIGKMPLILYKNFMEAQSFALGLNKNLFKGYIEVSNVCNNNKDNLEVEIVERFTSNILAYDIQYFLRVTGVKGVLLSDVLENEDIIEEFQTGIVGFLVEKSLRSLANYMVKNNQTSLDITADILKEVINIENDFLRHTVSRAFYYGDKLLPVRLTINQFDDYSILFLDFLDIKYLFGKEGDYGIDRKKLIKLCKINVSFLHLIEELYPYNVISSITNVDRTDVQMPSFNELNRFLDGFSVQERFMEILVNGIDIREHESIKRLYSSMDSLGEILGTADTRTRHINIVKKLIKEKE